MCMLHTWQESDSRMKYFGGCDAGSTYTKCVIIDENGKIAAAVTKRSRINPVLSAKDALDEAVSQVDGFKQRRGAFISYWNRLWT